MRFIELFAGIGGFRYGLEKANNSSQSTKKECDKTEHIKEQECRGVRTFNEKRRDSLLPRPKQPTGDRIFQCVYANEWDYDPYKKEKQYAWKIYQKQFGKKELDTRNIEDVPAESIPDHDFLTGGFPCPTYSIAGKRKGFDDPRGLIFFQICRVAKVKKPRLLLLENVKGLLNHDGGNTFRVILYSLSELGYDCEWEVLNSKNFGVPQNRERVFIVGHLRGTGGQKVFPIGEAGKENIIRAEKDIYVIHDKRSCGETRIYKNKSPAVTSTWGTGGGNVPSIEVKMGLYLTKEPMVMDLYNNKMRKEYPTLTAPHHNTIRLSQKMKIRRLTPTECERLQGFPDGWTKGISDTQRYKCLGNAVTTNVIEEIGRKILKVIK